VVTASSSAVYGDDPQMPKTENMKPCPLSPYAVQKLTGEYYASVFGGLYGLETVCLRYFNVFGPRQDPSSPYSGVISIFMSKVARDQAATIYGDGSQSRDFVYVKDVINANLLAATHPMAAGRVFNVGTGSSIQILNLWQLVGELSNRKIDPVFEPPRAGDIHESVADISEIENVLGYQPQMRLRQGLIDTLAWYRGMA
jgi:UDP-glucose 4-epimerase